LLIDYGEPRGGRGRVIEGRQKKRKRKRKHEFPVEIEKNHEIEKKEKTTCACIIGLIPCQLLYNRKDYTISKIGIEFRPLSEI